MTNELQFRLINVTPGKPKGEIVGYMYIENGLVHFYQNRDDKQVAFRSLRWDGVPVMVAIYKGEQFNRTVDFTHLEQLAPFKDKDGGDLYEGDRVEARDDEWDHIFIGILSYDEESCEWTICDDEGNMLTDRYDMNHLWNEPFIKLGSIHEEE